MNKLEISKKIAEIEKVDTRDVQVGSLIFPFTMKYNPFDWSILGPLMFKYEVDISHYTGWASISSDCTGEDAIVSEYFGDIEGAPMAILECIIKSKEQSK